MISAVANSGFSTNSLIAAFAGVRTPRPSTPQQKDEEQTVGKIEGSPTGKSELTDEEKAQVRKLEQRDAEVRRHEQAHKSAAGQYASGGPTFEFQEGPDGKQYAVGGEVQIDTSPVEGDPEATIEKMQQVRRAALAPGEPSGQDRQVAAQAAAATNQARSELTKEKTEETDGSSDAQSAQDNTDASSKLATTLAAQQPSKVGQFIDVAA